MNNPLLKRIAELRNGTVMYLDTTNKNRYSVILHESDGSKTAYCFATPIYDKQYEELLDMQFYKFDNCYRATGSNADIRIGKTITMCNAEGFCSLEFNKRPLNIYGASQYVLQERYGAILRTTNGIAAKFNCNIQGITFKLIAMCPYVEIRKNSKCFSLMREKYKPFLTFSSIGCSDSNGNIVAPALLEIKQSSDKEFEITISPQSPYATSVIFEFNLYEPKLFQDTTVETGEPETNNAFGGTAFIGNSAVFGEQQLYTRPDLQKTRELFEKQINKVVLHMETLNNGSTLVAHKVERRFCSFGTNWINKAGQLSGFSVSEKTNEHISFNLTDVMVNAQTRRLIQPDGIIIKSSSHNGGFTIIPTGDNAFVPQILEINYR